MAESMSSDNQFAYRAEIVRCHACATQARTMQGFVDDGGDRGGAMVRFTRTP